MKKLMMGLLVCLMAVSLVGCGENKKTSIDLSAYPEKFEEWTTKDVMKYFEDKGVFTKDNEQYIQVENDAINPVPEEMTELGSYMDQEGLINIFIYYFDSQTKSDKVKAAYEEAKKDKVVNINADGEKIPLPVTHMVGQFGLDDSGTTDPELKEKFEKAIDDLCADMNLTKDY